MATLILLLVLALLAARYLPRRRRRARRHERRYSPATVYQHEFTRVRPYVLQRDGHRCVRCGRPGPGLHVHHVVWRSRGGTNDPRNLVTYCGNCHHLQHRHR